VKVFAQQLRELQQQVGRMVKQRQKRDLFEVWLGFGRLLQLQLVPLIVGTRLHLLLKQCAQMTLAL